MRNINIFKSTCHTDKHMLLSSLLPSKCHILLCMDVHFYMYIMTYFRTIIQLHNDNNSASLCSFTLLAFLRVHPSCTEKFHAHGVQVSMARAYRKFTHCSKRYVLCLCAKGFMVCMRGCMYICIKCIHVCVGVCIHVSHVGARRCIHTYIHICIHIYICYAYDAQGKPRAKHCRTYTHR
jgi:hypothetical protein